jgi:hypothetical protein
MRSLLGGNRIKGEGDSAANHNGDIFGENSPEQHLGGKAAGFPSISRLSTRAYALARDDSEIEPVTWG